VAFDPIDFGDALLGPLPIGEGEHWATIACRVAVRGPRWAFPPRLPGGSTAAGPFLIRTRTTNHTGPITPGSLRHLKCESSLPVALGLGENAERWIMDGARVVCLVVFAAEMTSDKGRLSFSLLGIPKDRAARSMYFEAAKS
jgi:hypothetical protein